jgi:hypothetical protein
MCWQKSSCALPRDKAHSYELGEAQFSCFPEFALHATAAACSESNFLSAKPNKREVGLACASRSKLWKVCVLLQIDEVGRQLDLPLVDEARVRTSRLA